MEDILNLSFDSQDLGHITIRKYLYQLMLKLWMEKEQFSGKRPFGNSSWDGDLIICLIRNGLVSGKIDEDGYLEEYDEDEVDHFVVYKILDPLFGI